MGYRLQAGKEMLLLFRPRRFFKERGKKSRRQDRNNHDKLERTDLSVRLPHYKTGVQLIGYKHKNR